MTSLMRAGKANHTLTSIQTVQPQVSVVEHVKIYRHILAHRYACVISRLPKGARQLSHIVLLLLDLLFQERSQQLNIAIFMMPTKLACIYTG
jgi:hypothetical protein